MTAKFQIDTASPATSTRATSRRKTPSLPRYHAMHVTVVVQVLSDSNQSLLIVEEDALSGIAAQIDGATKATAWLAKIPQSGTPTRYDDGAWYQFGFSVTVDFEVDRSSLIIPNAEAEARVRDALPTITDAMVKAFDASVAAYEVRAATTRDVAHANAVLSQLNVIARDRAEKICRYQQRLAALNAELEAEKSIQAAELEAADETYTMEDGTAISDRAVRTALRALEWRVVGNGPFRTPRRLTAADLVKVEDEHCSNCGASGDLLTADKCLDCGESK